MAFGFREKFKEPEVPEFTQGECFSVQLTYKNLAEQKKGQLKDVF